MVGNLVERTAPSLGTAPPAEGTVFGTAKAGPKRCDDGYVLPE